MSSLQPAMHTSLCPPDILWFRAVFDEFQAACEPDDAAAEEHRWAAFERDLMKRLFLGIETAGDRAYLRGSEFRECLCCLLGILWFAEWVYAAPMTAATS